MNTIIKLTSNKWYVCSYVQVIDKFMISMLYFGNSFFGRSHFYRHKNITKDINVEIYYGKPIEICII